MVTTYKPNSCSLLQGCGFESSCCQLFVLFGIDYGWPKGKANHREGFEMAALHEVVPTGIWYAKAAKSLFYSKPDQAKYIVQF